MSIRCPPTNNIKLKRDMDGDLTTVKMTASWMKKIKANYNVCVNASNGYGARNALKMVNRKKTQIAVLSSLGGNRKPRGPVNIRRVATTVIKRS